MGLIVLAVITGWILRSAMETAFCGSDAEGAWVWKDAYEACEVDLLRLTLDRPFISDC